MLELNNIYNEDAILGLQQIQDESIDLIIADPPYFKVISENSSLINCSDNSIFSSSIFSSLLFNLSITYYFKLTSELCSKLEYPYKPLLGYFSSIVIFYNIFFIPQMSDIFFYLSTLHLLLFWLHQIIFS